MHIAETPAAGPPSRKRFMPISEWCVYSGMSRSGTYNAIGLRKLRAVKLGSRTLIDVAAGDLYLDTLPVATIRPPAAA
jgi:hypothetical protein